MKTVSDEEFERQIQADPINKALDDFLKAAGAGAVVLLAVGSDHSVRTMLFENGDVCECQEPLLKTAHHLLRKLATMTGGEPDPDRHINLQGMSHETTDRRKH